jgi:hypothetical protein
MPEHINLTGYSMDVLDCPPMPATKGKPGKMFVFSDKAAGKVMTLCLDNSTAKDIGFKAMGQGKVRRASADDLTLIMTGKAPNT